jgi:molecular chaperone DnaK (HSP70)
MELFLSQIRHMTPGFDPTPEQLQLIRNTAEHAKAELSTRQSVMIELDFPTSDIVYRRNLTRAELETISRVILDRTRTPCEQAIKDAKIRLDQIDEVVLVGGSTRMPAVRALVQQIFRRKPHDELNPDETVALGAAIQANVLAGGTTDVLLLDVTPLSLGIETIGAMMSTIIPRNTTIPTKVADNYTTFVDNQTGVEINVYQGERDFVKDNRKLASFTLKGIPPLPAGAAKVEVTFLIDADGILHVAAREVHTGIEQVVEVKPSYGLTDEEIERMLRDSIMYASEDIGARRIAEARTEGQRILSATEKVLGQLRRGEIAISPARLQTLNIASVIDTLYALRRALQGEDAGLMNSTLTALEQATEPLAQEIMNTSVAQALAGKAVVDV